jgi:hypothetical protein
MVSEYHIVWGVDNDFWLRLLSSWRQELSLDVAARRLSDVEIGWNSFLALSLSSGGLAGGSD